jgi:hypothetical protein
VSLRLDSVHSPQVAGHLSYAQGVKSHATGSIMPVSAQSGASTHVSSLLVLEAVSTAVILVTGGVQPSSSRT